MKRFTPNAPNAGIVVFREDPRGSWCKAEVAVACARKLAAFERRSIFARAWSWLSGFRVPTDGTVEE